MKDMIADRSLSVSQTPTMRAAFETAKADVIGQVKEVLGFKQVFETDSPDKLYHSEYKKTPLLEVRTVKQPDQYPLENIQDKLDEAASMDNSIENVEKIGKKYGMSENAIKIMQNYVATFQHLKNGEARGVLNLSEKTVNNMAWSRVKLKPNFKIKAFSLAPLVAGTAALLAGKKKKDDNKK